MDDVLSVSALTQLIKGNLEASYPSLAVEGEISGFKLASSGHLYFSLKDRDALIQAVMFKYRASFLEFDPADGMKVVARGGLSLYPARGQYQLLVQSMRKSGLGDILAMLEERKRRLAAEGLFDLERKRPLPRRPSRVGLVTSPTGAALRDILKVLGRRNSGIDILIFPAPVQGPGAPEAIAARIGQANAMGGIDVLIVGRGGGSPDDLLAFSEELVVRAVADSAIPVISAVGHEIDWALCDFAADLRAPTPSAAAEMVAESSLTLLKEVEMHEKTLASSALARLDYARASLDVFSPEDLEVRFQRIFMPVSRRFDDAREILGAAVRAAIFSRKHRIELADSSLELANPQSVLERGYSIVRLEERERGSAPRPGRIVRSASELDPGSLVSLQFSSGRARADVLEVEG